MGCDGILIISFHKINWEEIGILQYKLDDKISNILMLCCRPIIHVTQVSKTYSSYPTAYISQRKPTLTSPSKGHFQRSNQNR